MPVDFFFVLDQFPTRVSIPGNSLRLPEPESDVHPLGGNKKRVVGSRDPSRSYASHLEAQEDFLNLAPAQSLSSELRQDAIVPHDSILWSMSWIPRPETCKATIKTGQKKAGAHGFGMGEDLPVILDPVRLFRLPERVKRKEFRIARP